MIMSLVGLAGFIDAVAGGGGLITVPTYIAFGVPPEFILGTNKLVSTSGTSFATFRYLRSGIINFREIIIPVIVALVSSVIGAWLTTHFLSVRGMMIILLVIIPIIFVINIRKSFGLVNIKNNLTTTKIALRLILVAGIIGTYDGFFGPGTGAMLIIALVSFIGLDLREGAAYGRVLNFASNVGALSYFLIDGRVMWSIGLPAIVAGMTGNWLGSGYMLRSPPKAVKPILWLVLGLLMFKCIYDLCW